LASAPVSSLNRTCVPFIPTLTNHAELVWGLVTVAINKLFNASVGSFQMLTSPVFSGTSSTEEFLDI
jgi:hypothetical protein